MALPVKVLELFCGIGGFAVAAAGSNLQVVAACDHSEPALAVYRLNFPAHPARRVDLAAVDAGELTTPGADLWWLSPPCQPYSVRGRQRDLADPRAASLRHLLELLANLPEGQLPRHLALENVTGFASSQARTRLLAVLTARGYQLAERQLCPTELGVPMRRPRYYLVASRETLRPLKAPHCAPRPLANFLDPAFDRAVPVALLLPSSHVERFAPGLRILDPADPAAYTTCFTSAYGRSLMHAGAYLAGPAGVRRFAPRELAALLGLPPEFAFPAAFNLRKCWQLLGNSLAVPAVREVLAMLPGVVLAQPPAADLPSLAS